MKKTEPSDFSAIVAAPFGKMGIRTEVITEPYAQVMVLSELVYLPPETKEMSAKNALAAQAAQQIAQYFSEPHFTFSLPMKNVGTAFQKRVWSAIEAIPRGQVLTYGELAKALQSAPRAVGQACGANRFPLIIPCHRVTATGGLGGFAHHDDERGFYLSVKRHLLSWENVAAEKWGGVSPSASSSVVSVS